MIALEGRLQYIHKTTREVYENFNIKTILTQIHLNTIFNN